MRRWIYGLLQALRAALCVSSAFMLAGYFTPRGIWGGLAASVASALCALAVSRLPARRAWLRPAALIVFCVALGAYALTPAPLDGGKAALCLLSVAFMAAMALEMCRGGAFLSGKGVTALGIGAHMVCCTAAGYAAPEISPALLVAAVLFLPVALFSVNAMSVEGGFAARADVRPPRALLGRNRLLVSLFLAAAIVVGFIGPIKEGAQALGAWIARGVARVLIFLGGLFAPQEVEMQAGSGAGMMAGLGEAGEPALIWQALEKVLLVLTIPLALFLLFVLSRVIWRKLRALFFMLRDRLLSLNADAPGYNDTRESLLDLDEMRRDAGQRLRKAVSRVFGREPRYETLDARGRARFIVRALYRRSGRANEMKSLTLREAADQLNIPDKAHEDMLRVYELARYAEKDPQIEEVDRLKRAAKV